METIEEKLPEPSE
jgi:hypothetical protein